MKDDPRPAPEQPPERRTPAVVGRMLIVGKVGEGAMGVVYAAYDPDLDRKVAVKMLRPERGEHPGTRTRMLREAQALARLTHPNVVAIHDMGVQDDRVWLAMEFVKGRTLQAWCAARVRTWREIVDVFIQAARGITAAHHAGLLHRDIKPANIMIDDEDRVRVMDFGLVRSDSATESASPPASGTSPFTPDLTQSEALLGTPAYMAPEQFLRFAVDARADQYSLCVALWEALYGERPYSDASIATRAGRAFAGRRNPPTRRIHVPRWLHRVVERGLAPRPDDRYATMGDLLVALSADPTRRRRLLGAGLVACVGIATGLSVRYQRQQAAIARCDAAGAEIDEIWDDEARAKLHDGLLSTGASYAETTFEKMVPWLDHYVQSWKEARIHTCHAATIDHTWDTALAEHAESCLAERRDFLESVLELTSHPGTGDVARGVLTGAVERAAQFSELGVCRDERQLGSYPVLPDDSNQHAEIMRLRRVLGRIAALEAAGTARVALDLADQAQADADSLGWTPMSAGVALRRGALQYGAGDESSAEKTLEHAFFTAGRFGSGSVVVEAACALAYVVGKQPKRHEEGLRWAKISGMEMDRLGVPHDDVARSRMYEAVGSIHGSAGSYALAVENHSEALAIRRRVLGPEHPGVANALSTLALDHVKLGEHARAIELQKEAVEIQEETMGWVNDAVGVALINLGAMYQEINKNDEAILHYQKAAKILAQTRDPTHPSLAALLNNIGNAYVARGDFAAAIEQYHYALTIAEHSRGPDDVRNSHYHVGLGNAYMELRRFDLALEHHTRALTIREKARGPDHREVADALIGIGNTYTEQRQYERALESYTRGLNILQKALPADHPNTATALHNIGVVHKRLGALDRAREHQERALAMWEKTLGSDSIDLAYALTSLGTILEAQEEPEKARAYLQRAVDLRAAGDEDPAALAESRFALARVLWPEPNERSRALELARLARDAFTISGAARAEERTEVEAWLDGHTLP